MIEAVFGMNTNETYFGHKKIREGGSKNNSFPISDRKSREAANRSADISKRLTKYGTFALLLVL